MKVEKVVVRTIKRFNNRQAAVKACLLDSGVPEHLIEMYMGYDACDGIASVIPKLREHGLYFDMIPNIGDGHVCSSLGYYEIVRMISLSNKTTMVMNDDQRLLIPFYELQELLSTLPCGAKVFQTRWYLHCNEMRKFGNSFEGSFPEKPYTRYVKGFLASGDDVLIFTPEGAAWACEQMCRRSADLKAGHCIIRNRCDGLYTSINHLTGEIGGQGYWESGHEDH